MVTSELTWDGILLKLKEYGVKYVYAYYSGGGDSGAIDEWKFFGDDEEIEFTPGEGEDESPLISGFDTAEVLNLSSSEHTMLTNLVSEHFYGILNNVEDWYNNDGGWGEMVLQVDTGKYVVDNNCYISNTENYMHNGQFESHI